ncbi:hypothetical protein [Nocardia neocaledoniensis]|uniref:hypothetical protein n=1 Tax=Nocardia neocaledoniensis TaxID=236511 RepID=UPI0024566296|nr:hypothetical protein [Nocardia neocaledoniensis]
MRFGDSSFRPRVSRRPGPIAFLLLLCGVLTGCGALYGDSDPGAPADVVSSLRVGDCAHLAAFSDTPDETISSPTPAQCVDGIDGNARVVATAGSACPSPETIASAGACFALDWKAGACYSRRDDRWVRTGLCTAADPAVLRVVSVVPVTEPCPTGGDRLEPVGRGIAVCPESSALPRAWSDVYPITLDWRSPMPTRGDLLLSGAIVAVVLILLAGRIVRRRRAAAGLPPLRRSWFGMTAAALAVAALITLVVFAPTWSAEASRATKAEAFTTIWGITVVDPSQLPAHAAVEAHPVSVRVGTDIRNCLASSWFRNRATGRWERSTVTRRGESSGWQRVELQCPST